MSGDVSKTYTCDVRGCTTPPVTMVGEHTELPRGWGVVSRKFDICEKHAAAVKRVLDGE